MKAAGEDKSVVVTVLTGAGDYYCSGNDLSNFATIPPEGPKALAAQGKKVLLLVPTLIIWVVLSAFCCFSTEPLCRDLFTFQSHL